MTKKEFIVLPILWHTEEELKILEQNEENLKLGLKTIEIVSKDIFTENVAFFGFSVIIKHNYEGHDFSKIFGLNGDEYICTLSLSEVLEKIKND